MTILMRDVGGAETGAALHVNVGDAVKHAREAIGYSIDDLAETCGLTIDEIMAIEIGADQDEGRLRRVAAALKIELPAASAA